MRDGQGLPRFVEQEFRDFLTCGCLAAGFARFRCPTCRLNRLVPFSCKGRGFCPSCGGRRMTDRAAQLVDHVFPARASWRKTVVPPATSAAEAIGAGGPPTSTDDHAPRRARPLNRTWADLMQRSFGFDVLACPRCPGRLKLVALIRESTVIQRILRHLRLPADLPVMCPARDPPLPLDECDQRMPSGDDQD
jgi:hypothetical protein